MLCSSTSAGDGFFGAGATVIFAVSCSTSSPDSLITIHSSSGPSGPSIAGANISPISVIWIPPNDRAASSLVV